MSDRPVGAAPIELTADNAGVAKGVKEAEDLLRRYSQAVAAVGRAAGAVQPYGLIANVDGQIRRAAEAYELLADSAQRAASAQKLGWDSFMPSKGVGGANIIGSRLTSKFFKNAAKEQDGLLGRYERAVQKVNAGGFGYDQGGGLSERTLRMIEARGYGEATGPGANLFKKLTPAAATLTGIRVLGAGLSFAADQAERIERGDPFEGWFETLDQGSRSLLQSVPLVGDTLDALYRLSSVAGRFLWDVDLGVEERIKNHEERSKRLFDALGKAESQIKELEAIRLFGADSSQARRFDMERRLESMREALEAAGADANTTKNYIAQLGAELEKSLTGGDKIAKMKQLEESLESIRDAVGTAGATPIQQQLAKLADLGASPSQIRSAEEQLTTAQAIEDYTERRKALEEEIARITRDAADAWLTPMERQLLNLERLGATDQQIATAKAGLQEQERALDAARETADAEKERLSSLKEIEETLKRLRGEAAGLSASESVAQRLRMLGASPDAISEAIALQRRIQAQGLASDILNRPATSAGTFSAISASMMGIGRVDLVTISRTVSSIDAAVQSIERRIQFMEGNEFA